MSYASHSKTNLKAFLSEYKIQLKVGLDSIEPKYLEEIAEVIEEAINSRKTIYTCGNGGSSAIADHFVCDFLKGAAANTTIQPIIFSLASNTPTITAVANDISYDDVFSHQIIKYGTPGDILISISSSGSSQNIIDAIEKARSAKVKTISFVGFDGGKAKSISDYCIHIPVSNYGVVEDIHHSIMHILAQFIRLRYLEKTDSDDEIVF
jgi:phosphoheptose isomerase